MTVNLKTKMSVSQVAQQNQTSLLPKAAKKVLIEKQRKLKAECHVSNGLSRLLDASGDCV